MRDLLIVLGVVVLVILSSAWWPAIGQQWRRVQDWHAERRLLLQVLADPIDLDHYEDAARPYNDDPPASDDDAWVGELHAINQLGKFGDLTRPIAHQTHYEVEAVIQQLGIPDWIPEQWRVAA